jgi:hypothetical protein
VLVTKSEGDEDEDAVNKTDGLENKSAVDEGNDEMIGDKSAVTGDEDTMDWGITDDK